MKTALDMGITFANHTDFNVVWWHREEKSKGTLEPGKLADLVILDKDPVKVDPMAIRDIRVVQTVKKGQTIHTAAK